MQPDLTKTLLSGRPKIQTHHVSHSWNRPKSYLYWTFNSMESGAGAVGAGLLQPQTGRPVTKHCTAQGLTTTPATSIDIRKTASVITTQTLLNTVSINARRVLHHTPSCYFSPRVRVNVFAGEPCFIPMHWGYFPCTDNPEVFWEACRGGR